MNANEELNYLQRICVAFHQCVDACEQQACIVLWMAFLLDHNHPTGKQTVSGWQSRGLDSSATITVTHTHTYIYIEWYIYI